MDIPVYLIAGFLDSGKTGFINGILRDGFAEEDRTLLICCEEGELEYDPRVLSLCTEMACLPTGSSTRSCVWWTPEASRCM